MSHPVYQVPAGDVLPIFFSTYAGATGASITLTGLAVTDIEIYKDASTTQRASDAGYALIDTDGIDVDSLTGIHGFTIDTGDNTDAGFYTVGAWFTVVVSAVTVDGQTVNFIAAQFRLMPAESVAGKPKVDTDTFGGVAATASGGRPEVNTSHAAGTAWNSGAIGPNTLANDTLTAAKVAADVTTELQNGLATAAALSTVAGYLDTEIAAILALLDDPRGEPGQGAPPVNPDMVTKVDYLYKFLRNKRDNNGTENKLYADNGTTVDHKQSTSESGGTVTKGEWATGA